MGGGIFFSYCKRFWLDWRVKNEAITIVISRILSANRVSRHKPCLKQGRQQCLKNWGGGVIRKIYYVLFPNKSIFGKTLSACRRIALDRTGVKLFEQNVRKLAAFPPKQNLGFVHSSYFKQFNQDPKSLSKPYLRPPLLINLVFDRQTRFWQIFSARKLDTAVRLSVFYLERYSYRYSCS